MSTNPPSDGPPENSSERPPESSEPSNEPRRPFPWFWLGTLVGSIFSAVGLGLAAWAWLYVHEDLSPQLSQVLTDYLDRPVDLGEVEDVTFGSIRIGPSFIGESDTDSTTLEADSVVVKFDVLETVFSSTIGLDITVDEATGYLAQHPERGWLNIDLPEREAREPNRFDISVDEVRLRESELTLVPLPLEGNEPVPILLEELRGKLNTDKIVVADKDAFITRFELTGEPVKGGEITLKTEVTPVEAPPTAENDVAEDLDESEDRLAFATNMVVQADQTPLDDVLGFTLSTIKLQTNDVAVDSGTVSGRMEMAFRPEQQIDYSGTISVDDADILTAFLPLPVESIEGETQFQGNQWTVDRVEGDYGAIENIVAEGLIDFDNGYDLTAVKDNVSVAAFTNTVDLDLPVPVEGIFDTFAQVSGPIAKPRFSGRVSAATAVDIDRVRLSDASSDFLLEGTQLYLDNIAATPATGGSLTGNGQVLLGQGSPFTFQLAGRGLPAAEFARLYDINPGFEIGLVSADATVVGGGGGNVTTAVDWDAPNALYPGSGTVDINGTNLAFRDTVFAIGGGTVSGSGNLIDGLFDSDVTFQNVQLSAFSEDLRGDVNGRFQFSGSTADTRIGAIAAQGDITFSDGLASFNPLFDSFNSPLSAQVAWNGEQIQVIQATSNRLTASGTLTPSFDEGFTGLDRLDLDVTADDYALAELPFDVPDVIALSGTTDIAGRLTGNPTAPTFNGNVQLANLVVNNLPFNPSLAGTIGYSPADGLALDVAGGMDAIALNIGPFGDASSTLPSLDFDINWRGAIAQGQTQGDILTGTARNFPLAALNFPAGGAADIGQLRGTLTTPNFTANLATQTLEGDIIVDQLGVGYIGAGRLVGNVRYANRLATLRDAQLVLNENLYAVAGQVDLSGRVPTYTANLNTRKGNVQNLLTALSIYRLEDFRRGLTPPEWLDDPLSIEDLDQLLATAAAGVTPAGTQQGLRAQLNRLAELDELEADAAIARDAAPLPPLKELNGPFAGNIQLNGTGGDFKLDFALDGNNWTWGKDYSAEEVIAIGSLTPNILTLEPLRFASAITADAASETSSSTGELPPETLDSSATEAFVNLAGQIVFGRDTELTSTLQATAANINIVALRDILQLPVDISGRAKATASLGGTLSNPQLRGNANLTAAAINDTPITSAEAVYSYRDARFRLTSSLNATNTQEPLQLTADIPYAFNFMDTRPESEAIDVDISVQNEGLALLNIFTRQVAWESGEGLVNLSIGGTLSNPDIAGEAFVNNAVISAQVLPEPLTGVNGSARFVNDRIVVENLQGIFSQGQLIAAGIFPLRNSLLTGTQVSALSTPSPSSIEAPSEGTSSESIDSSETGDSETTTPVPEPNSPGPSSPEPNSINEPGSALFPRTLAANAPLTVNLENIDLTLEDLYSGGVNGQIIVGGNALVEGPQIGGKVVLANGEVTLSNGDEAEAEAAVATTGDEDEENVDIGDIIVENNTAGSQNASGLVATAEQREPSNIQPIFRNLELTLGDSIRVVQGNLLNFVADGTLLLSGPPTDLEPEGKISLRSGRVNLFNTTIFRLRGSNNTALFTPETGLTNPFLDVSLRASVPEVDNSGLVVSTPFAQAEIADTSGTSFENTGSLRTIRVRADVEGPASALADNLQLSSSPPRSQAELLTLIGGGFVTALESTVDSLSGGGDDFGGLINLVSGALLTNIQDFVGDALSLSEFRLFPVTAASRAQSEDNSDNGLDIGAEIGFDVTEDASLSIIKILTDDTNPEFGVNYRLTDSLTIRTNTNLDDINQVLLEYELRF
ncbi:MAG: translocation/assembly module TamB domain-containing protein [Cyanobacteria bacterium J06634_6]